jgi:alpha-N-acetylglucosamine transferase
MDEIKHKNKYAYVTLVMKGNTYCIGAITMAYSLRMRGCKYDIICMVTKDVDDDGRKLLLTVFTHIIEVPYIEFLTYKQEEKKESLSRLNTWIDVSYTKFHIFNMTNYEKIMFLDADMIIMENIDHIFKFQTPALNVNSKSMKLVTERVTPSGTIMKSSGLMSKLPLIISINAGSVLITPSKDHFKSIVELCRLLSPIKPFELPLIHSTAEEYILFIFFARYLQCDITLLGKEYNNNPWTLSISYNINNIRPKILHFALQKPWSLDRFEYSDTYIWWAIFHEYIQSMKEDIMPLIDKLPIKLVTPDGAKGLAPEIIKEGTLYSLYLKNDIHNKKCIYCTRWNIKVKYGGKVNDKHKTKECRFLFRDNIH